MVEFYRGLVAEGERERDEHREMKERLQEIEELFIAEDGTICWRSSGEPISALARQGRAK